LGYTPAESKWVAVPAAADSFEVRDASAGGIVFSGPLSLRRASDPATGDDVYEGDLSGVTAPGRYFIRVPGVGDSPDFVIDVAVYDDLYRMFVRGLYLQRCGTAITEEYGGAWTHACCHDHGASIASYDWSTTGGLPGLYLDTIGGWHDAGDYGKYCTNNAYTCGLLLQAYERYPDRFHRDDCGIPESGNGVPDLLDETRWSLVWMLKMQNGAGGVRHREAAPSYAGMYLPEEDPSTRYYTDVSSDATAVHAAAMALAARIYGGFDRAFAAGCSTSALSAWNWLQSNPDRVPPGGFQNLYGHESATYIAGSEIGRRLWAAAEIFRLTGLSVARDYIDAHWGDGLDFNGVWYPDSWASVENLGAFAYRDAPGATPGVVSGSWWSMENSVLSSAAGWQARTDADGYGCVASADGSGDYYWGFTGVILRYAWTMLEAFRYGADPGYELAAREQLHYILGRNPMGKVYVTGIGDRPVLHAHGAWNTAAGYTDIADSLCQPVPYLLVGGPNQVDNPDISEYPARCYEDIADPDYYYYGNYTLNETSVNIQASLIVLAGYFSTGGVATGVEESAPAAEDCGDSWCDAPLDPVCPNPFTQQTTVSYELSGSGRVRLAVFDVAGRYVRTLVDSRRDEGRHAVTWDGRDEHGRAVAAGVYFVRLSAAGEAETQKIVKLR
jgi:endoglucanase